VPPSLAAIYINEKSCVQRDIVSFHAGVRVDQAIGANHLGARITQDGELAVYDGLPDLQRVLAIVNTDGHKVRADLVELFRMLRELAQLTRTVGSPVPTVEDQKHPLAAHRREAKSLALSVLQGDIRRRFILGRRNLGLRENLLRRGKHCEQKKFKNRSLQSSQHDAELYFSLWGANQGILPQFR
jgi:hypothetical protein